MADTNAEVVDRLDTPITGVADTGTVALPELAEVVDGEVVEDEIVDEAVSRPPSVVQTVVIRPVQVVKVVGKHRHTRAAPVTGHLHVLCIACPTASQPAPERRRGSSRRSAPTPSAREVLAARQHSAQ